MLQEQPDTDGGEVAVGHLLVPQHALQQPLQVSLHGLQALAAAGQVGDVGGALPAPHTQETHMFTLTLRLRQTGLQLSQTLSDKH